MGKHAHKSAQFDTAIPTIGEDAEFELALQDFAEASIRTLERLLAERLGQLDDRIAVLAKRAQQLEVLEARTKAAEDEAASLRKQLQERGTFVTNNGATTVQAEPVRRPTPTKTEEKRSKLPANPSLRDVVAFLVKQGLNVQDNRRQGGSLWVFADDKQFAETKGALAAAGIGARYFPRGRTLRPGPQYEIDPEKALKA
jgi:hypothetical protein